jgi:hypothetical protein
VGWRLDRLGQCSPGGGDPGSPFRETVGMTHSRLVNSDRNQVYGERTGKFTMVKFSN